MGFGGQNKFVYQILAELDDDQSGGIDFAEFLRLATAKISDKDSRVETDKVWGSFDYNRVVSILLFREKSVSTNSRKSPRNWERTSEKNKSITSSTRPTSTTTASSLLMTSTTF